MDAPAIDRVRAAVGDRYEVETLFGQGGMGAVFLGRHRALGSRIAIKVLPVPAEEQTEELARFSQEARLAANLPHPYIVPVYEFDIRGGLAFFIMPFVEGRSLADLLEEQGKMELGEVLRMLHDVGSALAFAHERGVVHRDVKPANILQEEASGRWLLADFGVARPRESEGLTLTGFAVGTPAYMAPEQLAGGDVDGRADLYALAAVACEALTGYRPDVTKDALEIQVALRAARPDLSVEITRAVVRGLALDRDGRPPSVSAWLQPLAVGGAASTGGTRTRKWVLVAAGVIAIGAAAAGVALFRPDGAGAAAGGGTTIAVTPFALVGSFPEIDLRYALPQALSDQLKWIPEYRVVGAEATRQVLEEAGAGDAEEAKVALLAERFGATEVLSGSVSVIGEDSVEVALWVRRAGDARVIREARVSGSVDSLASLVPNLVTQAFAERVAREHAGWEASLPTGWEAIRTWWEGERAFRSAAYDVATVAFDNVIELDSTFAPAHFKRMLSEVFRLTPTRATGALRSALDAAVTYRARLDPTTAELLAAYEAIVGRGDLEEAHERLQDIVAAYPNATDAWFLLGYLQFYLGALIQSRPGVSRYAYQQARAQDPRFAGPIAQLALLAAVEGEDEVARGYFAEYLAIDSTSVWAELIRMSDSLLGGGEKALAVIRSFGRRPVEAMEIFALGGGRFGSEPLHRTVARDAIAALQDRAATAQARRIAFRLELASLLGSGRWASADSLVRTAARRRVPLIETDAWIVLGAVTGTHELGSERDRARAAGRLAGASDDAVAQWIAGRWYRNRDEALARAATDRLRSLARTDTTRFVVQSLWLDHVALDSLARGDSAAALRTWARATKRFDVEQVFFELVGSLWPLQLSRAQTAAALADHDAVLAATTAYEFSVGYNDQVAWWLALPLRADALRAKGDVLGARNLLVELTDTWSEPNGRAVQLRDRFRPPGSS